MTERACPVCAGTGRLSTPSPAVTLARKKYRQRQRRASETQPFATRHRQEWTDSEVRQLETSSLSYRDLALELGRSYSAVKNAYQRYGIQRGGTP